MILDPQIMLAARQRVERKGERDGKTKIQAKNIEWGSPKGRAVKTCEPRFR